MTRTLVLVAIVSFALAVSCFAGAIAIVGGPFSIDDGWRFHRMEWRDDGVDIRRSPAVDPASDQP